MTAVPALVKLLLPHFSDNRAAVVMGQQSYGKGTAQQIFQLSGGAELKVTIVHWFTPDDVSIEHKGITPQYQS
jgi:carboxyl-terminal processing protease